MLEQFRRSMKNKLTLWQQPWHIMGYLLPKQRYSRPPNHHLPTKKTGTPLNPKIFTPVAYLLVLEFFIFNPGVLTNRVSAYVTYPKSSMLQIIFKRVRSRIHLPRFLSTWSNLKKLSLHLRNNNLCVRIWKAVVRRCPVKKVFLNVPQNSQENTFIQKRL